MSGSFENVGMTRTNSKLVSNCPGSFLIALAVVFVVLVVVLVVLEVSEEARPKLFYQFSSKLVLGTWSYDQKKPKMTTQTLMITLM